MNTGITHRGSAISEFDQILEKSSFDNKTIVGLSADGKSIIKADELTTQRSNESLSALRFGLLRLKKPYEKALHSRKKDIIVPTCSSLERARSVLNKIKTADRLINPETRTFHSYFEEETISSLLQSFDEQIQVWKPLICTEDPEPLFWECEQLLADEKDLSLQSMVLIAAVTLRLPNKHTYYCSIPEIFSRAKILTRTVCSIICIERPDEKQKSIYRKWAGNLPNGKYKTMLFEELENADKKNRPE